MPESKNSQRLTKSGKPRKTKKYKSTLYLPRQCLMDVAKSLILLGFLDEDVDFTPYLHLWKIGSVDKMYGMTRDMF